MIATSEPQEFIPFGRRYLGYHPGDVSLSSNYKSNYNQGNQNLPSQCQERWDFDLTNDDFEEELYWKGKTAVWSRAVGVQCENQEIIKCFTVDNAISQALWCNFCKPGYEELFFSTPLVEINYSSNTDRCLCIVHDTFMDIINERGEEFVLDLQFQPKKVWKTFYGLLLERQVTTQEKGRDKKNVPAIMLSLMHPLNECKPLLMRQGCNVSYCTDETQEIIFTSSKPSLCVVYDSSTGVHSVAEIRKAMHEDFLHLPEQSAGSNSTSRFTNSNFPSKQSQLSVSSPVSHTSPYVSRNGSKLASPSPSRTHSPLSHMATLSRSQSPTPVCQHSSKASLQDSFYNQSVSYVSEPKPLPPDLCLEYIWSEPVRMDEEIKTSASKVFLHEDCVQQKYICYVVSSTCCLSCVRYEMTYDQERCILGSVSTISAIDATPLAHINMILVLKDNYKLILYSGLSKISIVHIPSIFGQAYTSFSKDFSNLSLHGVSEHAVSTPIARRKDTTNSSLPAVSPVVCDDSLVMLQESELLLINLIGLKISIKNVVIIETSDSVYYKLQFPSVSSFPLVKNCVDALKLVLPRDTAIQLFIKWYSYRNSYGHCSELLNAEWDTFAQMLLSMMGYDVDKLSLQKCIPHDNADATPVVIKKARSSENGTDNDWDYLLRSAYHREVWPTNYQLLGFHDLPIKQQYAVTELEGQINETSPLFLHIPAVFYTLHLLYEEMKLSCVVWDSLESLALLCHQLAVDLRRESYCDHYWRDFPLLVKHPNKQSQISTHLLAKLQFPTYFSSVAPDIYSHLFQMLSKQEVLPFPYIPGISSRTNTLVVAYGLLKYTNYSIDYIKEKFLKKIVPQKSNHQKLDAFSRKKVACTSPHVAAVMFLNESGIKRMDFESFPSGIILPIINAIVKCKESPPCDWNKEGYEMIGRKDLYYPLDTLIADNGDSNNKFSANKNEDDDDGMTMPDVGALGLRFSQDHRLHEVRRLLCSSKPVKIALTQRPDVTDHDFIEEQERHLYSLCIRTMALPVGRGMFTMGTTAAIVTEPLQIPKLCLTGKAPPRNNAVDLSHIDVPPNMNMWPMFHNGVAAGLKISSGNEFLGSNWIIFNKPKGSSEIPAEHAGVLMALGLNGQLNKLAFLNIHDYLIHGHELTTVGLLLGIAAAKRGTMDVSVTRMLSIHIEALLPPSSTELDVPANVQVAALLGVGLLYQQTGHRHMTEVLLGEIGRPPGPEMENSSDRESYSLAAGLALGLINLGGGPDMEKINDLSVPDYLYHYIVGGQKRPFFGAHKDRCRTPSYQIREGDIVNTDVTCPGAILALGMMFFRSNNRSIAKWMEPPETQCLLDFIRPDFLLLQSIARGLILWDEVEPSSQWIDSYVPRSILPHVMQRPGSGDDSSSGIDYEGMNQAYCNLIAGACMVIGLKFAGSNNDEAFKTLLSYAKTFLSLTGKSIADLAGKSTIETCLNTIVLSLAMVMSGSGNIDVLCLCRHLHSRIGQNSHVGYGSHMATHMSIGLLFLGGGRYTLATNREAIGAMLCAFFPKFPTHSNDNRYHLQAFRHLYVLAVEPRLIIPKEVTSDQLCYTHLKIVFQDTACYKDQSYIIKAPCLLPEIELLQEVHVEDPRYWPITFRRDKNWDTLKSILKGQRILPVKQKAGTLSYIDDPHGHRSLLAQNLANDCSLRWTIKPEAIVNFTSDPIILKTLKYCLTKPASNHTDTGNLLEEKQMQQMLSSILFKCVTKERLELFPLWVAFVQCLRSFQKTHKSLDLWQVKFALQLCKSEYDEISSDSCSNYEFALTIWSQWEQLAMSWETDIQRLIQRYLKNDESIIWESDYRLAAYLVMYDIPYGVRSQGLTDAKQLITMFEDMQIPPHTVAKLLQFLT